VGMTRAMDTLIMTRARYRRRYGNDMPESAIPSRFFDEVPAHLTQDMGSPGGNAAYGNQSSSYEDAERHYSYEDEDQSASPYNSQRSKPSNNYAARSSYSSKVTGAAGGGDSISNIAQFFSGRGATPYPRAADLAKLAAANAAPQKSNSMRNGQRVRHPKYGEGVVFRREGDGDDARLTVQFIHHGMKKLVEKFAQLERI